MFSIDGSRFWLRVVGCFGCLSWRRLGWGGFGLRGFNLEVPFVSIPAVFVGMFMNTRRTSCNGAFETYLRCLRLYSIGLTLRALLQRALRLP